MRPGGRRPPQRARQGRRPRVPRRPPAAVPLDPLRQRPALVRARPEGGGRRLSAARRRRRAFVARGRARSRPWDHALRLRPRRLAERLHGAVADPWLRTTSARASRRDSREVRPSGGPAVVARSSTPLWSWPPMGPRSSCASARGELRFRLRHAACRCMGSSCPKRCSRAAREAGRGGVRRLSATSRPRRGGDVHVAYVVANTIMNLHPDEQVACFENVSPHLGPGAAS